MQWYWTQWSDWMERDGLNGQGQIPTAGKHASIHWNLHIFKTCNNMTSIAFCSRILQFVNLWVKTSSQSSRSCLDNWVHANHQIPIHTNPTLIRFYSPNQKQLKNVVNFRIMWLYNVYSRIIIWNSQQHSNFCNHHSQIVFAKTLLS